jgi:activator of HSP90 ATPase
LSAGACESQKETIMAKTIRQVVTFAASPHEVYEALMDSQKHTAFSGEKATISRHVGGSIEAGGGYISGFPEGVMSKATFSLKAVEGGARLTLTHSGVPDELFDSIKDGWVEYYWQPLAVWLASQAGR